jgi:hypothetical protein
MKVEFPGHSRSLTKRNYSFKHTVNSAVSSEHPTSMADYNLLARVILDDGRGDQRRSESFDSSVRERA